MIKILIAEDHLIFRKGVVASLSSAPDIQIVGEADNGLDALNSIARLQPDLILMDLNMPVMGGVEAIRRIKQAHPHVLVVALTVSDIDQDLFEAVKAGADGYLLKNTGPEQLQGAVRQAISGESPLSPAVAAKILKEFRQGQPAAQRTTAEASTLTAREIEVLQLATQGFSYKEIGSKLYVAESTVKNHMRHIMEKLHLRNRSEAVTYALRHGLAGGTTPPRDPS